MAVRFINWDRDSKIIVADTDSKEEFIKLAARFVKDHGVDPNAIVPEEVLFGNGKFYIYRVPHDLNKRIN